MMPPRYIPQSSEEIEIADSNPVASTTYPAGTVLALMSTAAFRFAVDKEATPSNSKPVMGYTEQLTTVGENGYVSLIPFSENGSPTIVSVFVQVTAVIVS